MKKWQRVIVLLLPVMGFVTPFARASHDETATGVYSYSGQGLRVRFILDFDGVRQLRIDRRLFKGPIQVSETEGSGGEKIYTFFASEKNVVKTMSLIILFDTDSAVKAISGFYCEHREGAETMTHVLVISPAFHHLSLDDLPSAKQ